MVSAAASRLEFGRSHQSDARRTRFWCGKPAHIYAQCGRLPIFAGGNADVDVEMLTTARFALLISHDDPDREYAYSTAAEKSVAAAAAHGWTVVSMKDDWTTIFTTPTEPDPTSVT